MPVKYSKTKTLVKPTTGLKKHHKWMIGSFSSIVFIFMITSGVFMYTLFVKQNLEYNDLSKQIEETQSNINTLTESLMQTKSTLEQTITSLDLKVGSITEEVDVLKNSAGEDFSGIIESAIQSVVTIRTDVSQGTGFIITDDGYLVTNAHILSGGREVVAITYEKETFPAEFIGYSQNLDVALLKINGNHNPSNFGNSNNVQIGEKVIAIGNPLGLQFSVSEGIVSAVHRTGPSQLESYIQTDAALNPGNSGGPLINKKGEVIGINNFKIGIGENLGFALESNYIVEGVNSISEEFLNQTLI